MSMLFGLCAGLGRATPVSPAGPTLVDGLGVMQALFEGDTPKLHAMFDRHLPGFQGDLVAAAYYRSLWRLGDSTSAASACVEKAQRDIKRQGIDYLLCGQLLAGNEVLAGRMGHGAMLATTIRARIRPVLDRWAQGAAYNLGDLDWLDWPSLKDIPDAKYAVAAGDDIVVDRAWPPGTRPHEDAAYVRGSDGERGDASTPYFINVQVNDMPVSLPLDTGSPTTVLTAADAARLGVTRTVNYGRVHALGTAQDTGTPTRFGVIARLRIARRDGGEALTVVNAPVVVGGASSVLGIDLLAHAGPVVMREYELTIHPRAVPLSCHQPVRLASSPMGTVTLVFDYRIDGRMQRMMFDSGDNSYISGTSSATATRLSQTPSAFDYQDVTGLHKGEYLPAQITLGDDVSAPATTIRVHNDRVFPIPYVLGVGGLHTFEVAMDFDGGTACLQTRQAVPH